jgi:hypothetical protein
MSVPTTINFFKDFLRVPIWRTARRHIYMLLDHEGYMAQGEKGTISKLDRDTSPAINGLTH